MNKKRRKLYHFHNMIQDNISFFDYQYVKDNKGNKGTRYLLADPLTDDQKKKLSKYDNVIISECKYKYAPEIHHQTLIILK